MTTNLKDELLRLFKPADVIEVSQQQAEELGAFEEDALTEEEALAATEEFTDEEE